MDTTSVREEKVKEHGKGRHSGSGWAITLGVAIILLLFIAVLSFEGRKADAAQKRAIESLVASSSAAAKGAQEAASATEKLGTRVEEIGVSVSNASDRVDKVAAKVDESLRGFSAELAEIKQSVSEKTDGLNSMVVEALAEARDSIEERVGKAEERIISETAKAREEPAPPPQIRAPAEEFPESPVLPEGVRYLSSHYEREIVPYGGHSEWIPWRKSRGAWSVIVSPGIPGIEALVQRRWLEPPELIPVPVSGIISIPGEYRKIAFRMTTANPGARFAVWKRNY